MNYKFRYILIVLVIPLFLIINSCMSDNEELNLKSNNIYNFKMVNGEFISTNKYNEVSPILINDGTNVYLYFASDNPNLEGYKGGYDVYVCQWVNQNGQDAFSLPSNLNNYLEGFNTENDESNFTLVPTANGFAIPLVSRLYPDGKREIFGPGKEAALYNYNTNAQILGSLPDVNGGILFLKYDSGIKIQSIDYINEIWFKDVPESSQYLKFIDNNINSIGYIDMQYTGTSGCGYVLSKKIKDKYGFYLLNETGKLMQLVDFSTAGNDITPSVAFNGSLYFSSDIDGTYDLYQWENKTLPKDMLSRGNLPMCASGKILINDSDGDDNQDCNNDKTPPGEITEITFEPLQEVGIKFNWINPVDPDYQELRVCRILGDCSNASRDCQPNFTVSVDSNREFTDDFQDLMNSATDPFINGLCYAFYTVDKCGNKSEGVYLQIDGMEDDGTVPTVLGVQPTEMYPIPKTSPIEVFFSKPMDPSTLSLTSDATGAFISEIGAITWLDENTHVTITPSTFWTAGDGKILKIDCKDNYNRAIEQKIMKYRVVEAVMFVNQVNGNDGNAGFTPLTAKATIQNAISTAVPGIVILVSQGTYSGPVNIADGVSLSGGFSQDWMSRDPKVYTTVITDNNASPTGVSGNPDRAVYVPSIVMSPTNTFIEGFQIDGNVSGGSYSSAIFVDAGSIKINDCVIHSGTSNENYCIYAGNYSDIKVNHCHLDAGTGSQSYGINMNTNAKATIVNNYIRGGSGSVYSSAIAFQMCGTTFYNLVMSNVIDAGNGGSVEGISIMNSNVDIFNNTIIESNSPTDGKGIIINQGPVNVNIKNNIITASGAGNKYGIYEGMSDTSPLTLENNVIFDCASGVYYDYDLVVNMTEICGAGSFGTPACTQTLITPTGIGNKIINPNFVSASDFHLTQSTPSEVKTSGADLSSTTIVTDMDGKPRTMPWSIGAYEFD